MSRSRSLLAWLVAGAAVLTARLALQVDLLDDASEEPRLIAAAGSMRSMSAA